MACYTRLISCAIAPLSSELCVCVFQVGHVTKTGDIAGPRVLEHIVDAVLYMEVGTLIHFLVFLLINIVGSSLIIFYFSRACSPAEVACAILYCGHIVLCAFVV